MNEDIILLFPKQNAGISDVYAKMRMSGLKPNQVNRMVWKEKKKKNITKF